MSRKLGIFAILLAATLNSCAAEPQEAELKAIDPISIATTAYKAASTGLDFLRLIGYLPSKPDPIQEIKQKVIEIGTHVKEIRDDTKQIMNLTQQLADASVREQNEKSLNEYLDAMANVERAQIALQHMVENPTDANLRQRADEYSHIAVWEFQKRPTIFRTVGPLPNDVRFYHLNAYPGYLVALNTRLLFIQAAYGKSGFIERKSKLEESIDFLTDLRNSIDRGVEVKAVVKGEMGHAVKCEFATLVLTNTISYEKEEALKHQKTKGFQLPDVNCGQVNSWLKSDIDALRATETVLLGSEILKAYEDRLRSYATFGYDVVTPKQDNIEFAMPQAPTPGSCQLLPLVNFVKRDGLGWRQYWSDDGSYQGQLARLTVLDNNLTPFALSVDAKTNSKYLDSYWGQVQVVSVPKLKFNATLDYLRYTVLSEVRPVSPLCSHFSNMRAPEAADFVHHRGPIVSTETELVDTVVGANGIQVSLYGEFDANGKLVATRVRHATLKEAEFGLVFSYWIDTLLVPAQAPLN